MCSNLNDVSSHINFQGYTFYVIIHYMISFINIIYFCIFMIYHNGMICI